MPRAARPGRGVRPGLTGQSVVSFRNSAPTGQRRPDGALLSLSLVGLTPPAYGFGGLLDDLFGPRGIVLASAAVVALPGILFRPCRPIRETRSG